jgi:LmbE family N-acetylglucosaminyl deacetylase
VVYSHASDHHDRCIIKTLNDILDAGARVLWVAAHPDDECFSAGILAYSSLRLGNPLHLLVLTRGEGGEHPKKLRDGRELGEIRQAEMEAVAAGYKASLEVEGYFNASLPVTSFPMRHELGRMWAERLDPIQRIAETIRRFKPDVLLTFPPEYGATGHPEHQLASRFATAGLRLAAEDTPAVDGEPHRVTHCYYLLHRYKGLKMLGMPMDPREPTETFDARQDCIDGKSCLGVMSELTRHHKTQNNDMRTLRIAARFMKLGYLHKVDPFTEIHDPYEEHLIRGMG